MDCQVLMEKKVKLEETVLQVMKVCEVLLVHLEAEKVFPVHQAHPVQEVSQLNL